MKNSSLLYLLFAFFTLVSCSNEKSVDPVVSQQSAIDQIKIQKVVSIGHGEAQRLAYIALSPQEKQFFWNKRLDRILADNAKAFFRDQKDLLKSLRSQLEDADRFVRGSDKQEIFINTFLTDRFAKAKKAFSEEELYNIGYTLNSSKEDFNQAKADANTNPSARSEIWEDCICSRGSSFTCISAKFSIGSGGGQC